MGVTAGRQRQKHLAAEMPKNTLFEAAEKTFAKADKDGGGKVTINEFKDVVSEIEEEEERGNLKMMLKTRNVENFDGEKMLSWEEMFKIITEECCDEEWPKNKLFDAVEKAFAKADKDGSGKMKMNEFKTAVSEIEEEEERGYLEMLIISSKCNVDEDKILSLEEILKIITAEGMDENEMLTSVFKSADIDGKGFLIASEVKEVLLRVKPHLKADIEKNVDIFMRMDPSDGEKKFNIEEAACLFTSRKVDVRGKMKSLFRMCDCDGDGFISRKELVNWMKFMLIFSEDDFDSYGDDDDDYGPEEQKMFMNFMADMSIDVADKDGDGKLNYDEFCIMNEMD